MTIALGILADDGLVVAADTQVTVPNYMKTDEGKVSMVSKRSAQVPHEPPTTMIVSGAGAQTSIDYLRNGLMGLFDGSAVPSPVDVGEQLSKRVLEYHDVHVSPHGNGELDVWMIVAAVCGQNKRLWTTDKSVTLPHSSFAAVGAGATYAKSLLRRLWAPMDTARAALLAAYVVYETKKLIDGCGQYTDVWGIGSKAVILFNRDTVQQLEDCFERHHKVSRQTLYNVFGGSIGWFGLNVDVPSELEKLGSDIAELLAAETQPSSARSSPTSPCSCTRNRPRQAAPEGSRLYSWQPRSCEPSQESSCPRPTL